MEGERVQIPFEEVLASLFEDETMAIHQLYRLSDMGSQESADFHRYWSASSDERRGIIVRHLADVSEENFIVDFSPIFTLCLQDSHSPVRIAALDGLWDSTDVSLVEPIINMLENDPSTEVKVAAARSLAHFLLMSEWGQLKGADTAAIFEALSSTYEDALVALPVKCAALEAMGSLTLPRVVKYFEEAFDDSVQELQLSAMFAMGISADPRWLPILLDEMESPVTAMRAEAARASGAIGSSSAVAQLAELIFDEDEDVARAAITALAQIGGDDAHHSLEVLLSDSDFAHLHEAAEEAIEATMWLEADIDLYPWLKSDNLDDISE
jgi:HEAT repeat protein